MMGPSENLVLFLTMPDYKELETNLIDVVKEFQAKIGYSKDPVYLYYPLDSLNSLLNTDFDINGMNEALSCFLNNNDISSNIKYSNDGDRFCIIIPEDGATYIYKEVPNSLFLLDFISEIGKHERTFDDIKKVFEKHSNSVRFEKMSNGEFDYVLYFEDGIPDKYRYCVKFEGEHTIYHRFTEKDYLKMM